MNQKTEPIKNKETDSPNSYLPVNSGKQNLAYLYNIETGENYPLYEGKNIIGRTYKQRIADIDLRADRAVSHIHAIIKLTKKENKMEAIITDNGELNNGDPSSNGVFINVEDKRISKEEVVAVKQNDIIIAGNTKLLFMFADNKLLFNPVLGI